MQPMIASLVTKQSKWEDQPGPIITTRKVKGKPFSLIRGQGSHLCMLDDHVFLSTCALAHPKMFFKNKRFKMVNGH